MKSIKRIIISILSIPVMLLAAVVSLVPLKAIRSLNPIIYFLLWKVIGYRKKVVFENLSKAFPKNSEADRRIIAKAYYKHLSELMLDTIAFISIRKSTLKKLGYFEKENLDILDKYYSRDKSYILAMSHFGSWEVLGALFNQRYPNYAVAGYRPLTNRVVDFVIHFSRKRLNNLLIPMKKLARKTFEMVNTKTPFALMLISDQRPPLSNATIVDFLGIETPFYNGIEKLSRKFNLPVVFVSTSKKENGTYSIYVKEITNDPHSLPKKEIALRYASLLEQEIIKNPAQWLWSHRRWK